jgi:hypothetical protein
MKIVMNVMPPGVSPYLQLSFHENAAVRNSEMGATPSSLDIKRCGIRIGKVCWPSYVKVSSDDVEQHGGQHNCI